jgi:poly(hydroxyalkanoate) depolymerase family esterase
MVKRRRPGTAWAGLVSRGVKALSRLVAAPPRKRTTISAKRIQVAAKRPAPRTAVKLATNAAGDWLSGIAPGPTGPRRYRLYRPPGIGRTETLPLMVMLHGCGQDAESFAASTRMNAIAASERFLVLYPEQDKLSNAHGCWNWFATRSGRARGEAAAILSAIDQACALYRADPARVAVAGLSAGASMAALLAIARPARFAAVAMHSGVGPGMAQSSATALAAMQGRRRAARIELADGATLPPLLVIQGTLDRIVAHSNGRAAVRSWVAAGDAVDGVPARESAPRRVQRGQRHPMDVTDFRRRGRLVASLIEVVGLGHAWSGGAARQPFGDPAGPAASRLVWAFAARQFAAMLARRDAASAAPVVPLVKP